MKAILERMTRRPIYWGLAGALVTIISLGLYSLYPWQNSASRPFTSIALEPLLVQPGDFPPDIITTSWPQYAESGLDKRPGVVQYLEQWVREAPPHYTGGSISIGRYETQAQAEQAFAHLGKPPFLSRIFLPPPSAEITGVGERATVEGPTSLGEQYLRFIRCQAVIHLGFDSPPNYDTPFDRDMLIAYAYKLDQRLQQALC